MRDLNAVREYLEAYLLGIYLYEEDICNPLAFRHGEHPYLNY